GLLFRSKESLTQPMCQKWEKHKSEKFDRRVFALAPPPQLSVIERPFKKVIETLVATLRPAVKLVWITHNVTIYDQVFAGEANCSLAALISFFPLTIHVEPHLQYQGDVLSQAVVVVPAGLGPHPGLLKAVTAEFSVALWVATALAVVGMTVALAVASACRGRPRLAALAAAPLQALAPLLAQAPPGRTAHRPLSAVWLLMSVVLAAAYQGLLLRELTSPPGEINSLEQLEQSGLEVVILEDLYWASKDYLPRAITSQANPISPFDLQKAIKNVSEGKKSALICYWDAISAYDLMPLLTGRKRVHTLRLPFYNVKASAMFTKGSPLYEPLIATTSRFFAGGLHNHLTSEYLAAVRPRERVPDPGDQLT
ncbi:Ionotropic receptor 218, partial [Frankliniella occidentalis]